MKAIKSTTGVSSKRLKIDLAAIRESIETGEVEEVIWVPGKQQVADIHIKAGVAANNILNFVRGEKEEEEKRYKFDTIVLVPSNRRCWLAECT